MTAWNEDKGMKTEDVKTKTRKHNDAGTEDIKIESSDTMRETGRELKEILFFFFFCTMRVRDG